MKKPARKSVRKPAPSRAGRRDFLLEVGTEEIPASYLPPALEQLRELALAEFAALRLAHGPVIVQATPRRLVLRVAGVADAQEKSVKEIMGPARSVAFGPDGKPTRAGEGFARSQGVEVSALRVVDTPKGPYVAVVKEEASLPAARILPAAVARIITSLHFPKFQRWGSLSLRFPRPIRWILCLLGHEVVKFDLEGIPSGRLTRGHRFLAPGPFAVREPGRYDAVMKRARVVVDQEKRKTLIRKGVQEAARKLGGKSIADEDLLDTVAYLVEYPVVVTGNFDRKYLALPWEVLATSMRSHQKYFAVTGPRNRLLPHFVTVSNNKVPDSRVVARGNERVLRARLEDAMFFFAEDRKIPLKTRASQLKSVVYQEKLGTSWEKMERFSALADRLAQRLAPEKRAEVAEVAHLCKADLVTLMVGEFAELQGVMGREYARLEDLDEAVARGIHDHYLPRQSGGETPGTVGGAIVGIADRIDTVCGCFAIGITPTGTADPYGLRRHALAVIAILMDRLWRLSLREAFGWSLGLLSSKVRFNQPEVETALVDFFRNRLQHLLAGRGHRIDLVNAVLETAWDDPVDAAARLAALTAFAKKSAFGNLMISVKRVMNIIPAGFSGKVDESLAKERVESDLVRETEKVSSETAALFAKGDYQGALSRLARLKGPVDAFFEGVLVMDKDEKARENRLAILQAVSRIFGRMADFRKVVTE